MSVSPAEGTTTNIFSRGGRVKQEAPGLQEAAAASGVFPSAQMHLGGGTTTECDSSTSHGLQGGLQGPGAGAVSAKAWVPSWQTTQTTGLSTGEAFSALNL